MFNHVQVVTTKAKVVPTFKALIALKQALGFQTSKKDINLQPCDGDLQTVMQHMIVQMLHERGWHALQPTMLLKSAFLEAQRGSVSACSFVHIINMTLERPSRLSLTVQLGVARFRPLSLPLLEPPAPDASPKDWERFNDKLWSMQLACCLLPDMRPALLAGMQLDVADVARVRETWMLHHGLSLPAKIPCYYQVRFSVDPDEPVAVAPSCCVWTESGLSTTRAPASADGAADLVLRQLAGDLARSQLDLWPGEQLAFALVSLQQDAACKPQAASAWRSARDAPTESAGGLRLGSAPISLQLLDPLLDKETLGTAGKPNVAYLGANLSRMLLNLEPGESSAAPVCSVPQLRASRQQQERLSSQPLKPPAKQGSAPALRRPAGADVAARWQHAAPESALQALPVVDPPVASCLASHHSSTGAVPGFGPAGTSAPQLQKPVFSKHKRPGPQLQARATPAAKAAPSGVKKARVTPAAPKAPLAKPQTGVASTPQQQPAQQPAAAGAAAAQPMPAGAAQAAAGTAGAPAKPKAAPRARQKASDLDAAQVEAKVRQMCAQGLQEKLSIPEIKCFLKARKVAVGGKKADLLSRLSGVLKSAPAS